MQGEKSGMATPALAALLGVWAIGGVSPAEAQLKYTGCLTPNGKIVRVAPGDSPSKPCRKKKQTKVTFSGTDNAADINALEMKTQELMDKDDELMSIDANILHLIGSYLQGQIDAMQEQIAALEDRMAHDGQF